jgi:2,5-diamino-6-(ribosylamino)-4(3H)-pyrimidinone 5'-phosphate reductase
MPNRPYVHINCASTIDGKIALPDGGRLSISTKWDKKRVHRLRASLGAVLVGAGTIISDDPKLAVNPERAGGRKEITKIALDGAGRVTPTARFLRTEGRSIIVTTEASGREWARSIEALRPEVDVTMIVMPGGPAIDIGDCFEKLHDEGVGAVLVEGGSDTIARVIAAGHFDMLTVFYGSMVMGGNGPTVAGGCGFLGGPLELELRGLQMPPGGGLLVEYGPRRSVT